MNRYSVILIAFIAFSCGEKRVKTLTAQQIIDKSIEVCGGDLYKTSSISFDFRDKTYVLERIDGEKLLKRITTTDSTVILDIRGKMNFKRYINDSLVALHDTLAIKYSNSVNSVHYFAYLPFGLNDPAVNKELLGKSNIKDQEYYKIKVTFNEQGGGNDFDDIYLYWFNTKTLKPDYLAYEFHVDGGGMRFREAFNERTVKGIRFVDYNNYKPKAHLKSIFVIDSVFEANGMELMSKIELKNIIVE